MDLPDGFDGEGILFFRWVVSQIRKDTIYSPLEAAYYARLPVATVRAWIKGIEPAVEAKEDDGLSFLEFLQLLAVREHRDKGVSLPKIREALNFARESCGLEYPFAAKNHESFLDGKNLHIRLKGEKSSFSITGRERGQMNLQSVVELYMTKLEFDENGLAKKYTAHDHKAGSITISPGEHYDQAIVSSVGHSAFALAEAAQSEGGFAEAAEVFGVPGETVVAAVDFVDSLERKPAA